MHFFPGPRRARARAEAPSSPKPRSRSAQLATASLLPDPRSRGAQSGKAGGRRPTKGRRKTTLVGKVQKPAGVRSPSRARRRAPRSRPHPREGPAQNRANAASSSRARRVEAMRTAAHSSVVVGRCAADWAAVTTRPRRHSEDPRALQSRGLNSRSRAPPRRRRRGNTAQRRQSARAGTARGPLRRAVKRQRAPATIQTPRGVECVGGVAPHGSLRLRCAEVCLPLRSPAPAGTRPMGMPQLLHTPQVAQRQVWSKTPGRRPNALRGQRPKAGQNPRRAPHARPHAHSETAAHRIERRLATRCRRTARALLVPRQFRRVVAKKVGKSAIEIAAPTEELLSDDEPPLQTPRAKAYEEGAAAAAHPGVPGICGAPPTRARRRQKSTATIG
ncbi:hypothetical protein TraAM80_09172 [Trypanosoma rangeli]|uniref:Uncharacterized protein n=1 Tax=Trypanosoma rangeli TaxID=5698 RepID=A0A3R7KMZ1_TRYRA|nr:uncharacterized protein TraAM80_09172 [Trypanosoma rangeli]RNE97770.1 hypothetical protein TraAM80_09172 [Trypanosoma rangeli]|eukprot:RNE97770.1 hypothetical protein TraAM80_09172 [Trypanosoma rangeli]